MINLLKKFKNVLSGIATVQHSDNNAIYLRSESVQIKLFVLTSELSVDTTVSHFTFV